MNKFENFAVHWYLSKVDDDLSYEETKAEIKKGNCSIWEPFEDFFTGDLCNLMDDMVWALEGTFK